MFRPMVFGFREIIIHFLRIIQKQLFIGDPRAQQIVDKVPLETVNNILDPTLFDRFKRKKIYAVLHRGPFQTPCSAWKEEAR